MNESVFSLKANIVDAITLIFNKNSSFPFKNWLKTVFLVEKCLIPSQKRCDFPFCKFSFIRLGAIGCWKFNSFRENNKLRTIGIITMDKNELILTNLPREGHKKPATQVSMRWVLSQFIYLFVKKSKEISLAL